MRRLLKFLHTMGAIGLMGAMVCLVVLMLIAPPPTALPEYALLRHAMAAIATWVYFPSFVITLVAGLLAIAFNRAYQNAGWAWVKLLSGIVIFESSFVYVVGPLRQQADEAAEALASHGDPAALVSSLGPERNTLWVLLGVATFNVVFGIWRPRLTRLPD